MEIYNSQEFIFNIDCIEKYEYSIECEINIKSHMYYATEKISINPANMKNFLNQYNTLQDNIRISLLDADSDAYINIEKLDNLGHYKIEGQIGGTHNNEYLRFSNKIDQTFIYNLSAWFDRIV